MAPPERKLCIQQFMKTQPVPNPRDFGAGSILFCPLSTCWTLAATPRTSATQTQTKKIEEQPEVTNGTEGIDAMELTGGPGRIRTYNQQIMSLLL
jgi:hypothetical protein